MNMRFFSIAAREAEKSDFAKEKVGCCVVYKKNKVLNVSNNTIKSHPIQKKYNMMYLNFDENPHSMHAEVASIVPLLKEDIDWKKVSIYLYRKRKSASFGMSRPCSRCMKMLKDLGVHNICYTTDDGYAEERI